MELKSLIKRCKNNEIDAQEQLYRLYSRKLFGLCLKYSNSYDQAQDNLQDGFMTIFDKIAQYEHKGSFEGWMKRIVINTALKKHRNNKTYGLLNEEMIEDTDLEVEHNDLDLKFLLGCIQQLPDRYRQVFSLYVLDDFSHRDIADMLQISEGTSKSNLARARMILKDKIEEYQNNYNSAKSS